MGVRTAVWLSRSTKSIPRCCITVMKTVVFTVKPVGHIAGARLGLALQVLRSQNVAGRDGPVFGQLIEDRKRQMQLDGAAPAAGRSPAMRWSARRDRAVHQSQRLDRLTDALVPKIRRALWLRRPNGRRTPASTDGSKTCCASEKEPLAMGREHTWRILAKRPAGMAQRVHGLERGIEQAEEQPAEVSSASTWRRGSAARRRLRLQERLQPLTKLIQQFPALQVAFLCRVGSTGATPSANRTPRRFVQVTIV